MQQEYVNGELTGVLDVKANRNAFIVKYTDFSIKTYGLPAYGGNTTRYMLPSYTIGSTGQIFADGDGTLGILTSDGAARVFGKMAYKIDSYTDVC